MEKKKIIEILKKNHFSHDYYSTQELLDKIADAIIKELKSTSDNNKPDISCKCTEADKHGDTTIRCCNECGLPVEDFWTN